jgi:hypothetical protein
MKPGVLPKISAPSEIGGGGGGALDKKYFQIFPYV